MKRAPKGYVEISVSEVRVGDLVLINRARKWRHVREIDGWGHIVCSIRTTDARVDVVVPPGITRAARAARLELVENLDKDPERATLNQ